MATASSDRAAGFGPSGSEPLAVAADLTTKEDADRAVAETVDHFGQVDVIINAVGGGAGKVLFEAQDYPIPEWDWIMELNVRRHASCRPRPPSRR